MINSTQCPQFHPLCSDARQTNFAYDHMETTNSLTWMRALNGALEPNYNEWADLRVINLPGRYRLCCFDSDEMRSTYIVSSFGSNHSLNSTYKKYLSLCVGEERFGSGTESRLYKHARVMASWVGNEGEISLGISRPGRVNYFLKIHFLLIRNSMDIVLLMCSG